MRKVLIKDIGKVITGNTPSKTNTEFYASKDIGFVKPDIIADSGISFINSTNEYISETARSKARIVERDTVFVTCIGSIGKVGIAEGREYAFNQQINAIEVNEKAISKYLAYNLLSNKNRLVSMANAPVVPIINKTHFENFEIFIDENIHNQKKIVNILDKANQINKLKRSQLNELDNLIKSRFVEMFGDPVENTMNWKMYKLGDLSVQINSGNTPKGGEQVYVDKGITFFRSQNVWKDRLEMDDVAFIDEDTHRSMKRSSLKHGDILMTKTGRINTENSSLGRAALYLGEDDAANVNGHVYFIRLKPDVNNKFILKILVSKEYLGYIRSVCVGGIDKRQLNKNHIEDFPIICPPRDMQNKFIDFVQIIEKLKAEVQKSLNETQILFDSLMQKYFG